jgi:hypothetical protein
MVLNHTFNNNSVTSWRSVLLVEETTDLPQITDNIYHIMLYREHSLRAGFELTPLVVIGTDCNPTIILSRPRRLYFIQDAMVYD